MCNPMQTACATNMQPTSTPTGALGLASHMMTVFISFPNNSMKNLATAALALLMLAGCTAEQKIHNAQKEADTLKEQSGFNACMKTFDEYEKAFAACIENKLRSAGYTDGLNCIEQPEAAPCKVNGRYNAGVYANNDCQKEVPDARPDGYSCYDLLNK